MPNRINRKLAQVAVFSSLLGTFVLGLGIAMTILFHHGAASGPYLLQNHFVSELGWVNRSPLARVFNGSMAVGSLFFAPIVWALGSYLRTGLGYAATVFSLLSIAAARAVGFLPMDSIAPHLLAAMLFFVAWMIAVALFTIAFWQDESGPYSKLLAGLGVAAFFSCLLLLLLPKDSLVAAILAVQHHQNFIRPEIWWLAVMEWTLVIFVWLWMLAATAFVWHTRADKTSP